MKTLLVLFVFAGLVALVQGQDLACQSGQIVNSTYCIFPANASLCNFTIPTELGTVNPPAIVPQKLRLVNDMALLIQQAFTDHRQLVSVILSNKALCNYPGPMWAKGVDLAQSPSNCLDDFTGVIPWNEFYNTTTSDQINWGCGLELDDSDPNVIIYRGEATVTWLDIIMIPDPVRPWNVTRETTSVLKYQLEYPKQVSIEASVTQVSEPRVLSAVTQQKYNATTGKLHIQVTTSVQTPYRLSGIDVATEPSLISSVQSLLSDCANGSSPCIQQWSIELTRSNPKCDFNGAYNFTFTTGCQDPTNCFFNDTQIIKSVAFSLTTGDVCGSVTDVTSVTAQLASYGGYEGGIFSTAKNAFLPDQKVYFQLSLTSDSAELVSSSIQTVTATDVNGVAQTLVSNGVAQIASFATVLVSSSTLNQIHELEFLFESSWFGALSPDEIASSTITVTAALNFNGKRTETKKMVLRSPSNEADASTNVSLKGAETQEMASVANDESLPTMTTTIIGAIVGVGVGFVALVAFIAIFIYKKVSHRRPA